MPNGRERLARAMMAGSPDYTRDDFGYLTEQVPPPVVGPLDVMPAARGVAMFARPLASLARQHAADMGYGLYAGAAAQSGFDTATRGDPFWTFRRLWDKATGGN